MKKILLSCFATVVAYTLSAQTIGGVYGGGRMADVDGTATVRVVRCDTIGVVYGAADRSGNVSTQSDTGTLVVIGVAGSLDSNRVKVGRVFGGGNGMYYCNDGEYYRDGLHYTSDASDSVLLGETPAHIPTVNRTCVKVYSGKIFGSLYGGGNLANVGFDTLTHVQNTTALSSLTDAQKNAFVRSGSSLVQFFGGVVDGNVFGACNMSSLYGYTQLYVDGRLQDGNYSTIVRGDVYATNDIMGSVKGRYLTLTSSGGDVIAATDGCDDCLHTSSYVKLTGDVVLNNVFGGGNGNYDYYNGTFLYDSAMAAQVHVKEPVLVCRADANIEQYGSFVDVNIGENAHINRVFGGGNNATVQTSENASIRVLLNCVKPSSAFADRIQVDTVFCGNNLAALEVHPDLDPASTREAYPNVTLKNGRVGVVFGGGNAGNITIGDDYVQWDNREVAYIATHVKLASATVTADELYGGSNMADVEGNACVTVSNGLVRNVYGASNISGNTGRHYKFGTHVVIDGGVVEGNVFGGANGRYGCIYSSTTDGSRRGQYKDNRFNRSVSYVGMRSPSTANTSVEIHSGALIKGSVYVGGDRASVGYSTITGGFPRGEHGLLHDSVGVFYRYDAANAKLLMDGGEVLGNIYGGGNMSTVYGYSNVDISGGKVRGAVYGGNDKWGFVEASVDYFPTGRMASDGVTQLNFDNSCTYVWLHGFTSADTISHVFGGGNGAYTYNDDTTDYYTRLAAGTLEDNEVLVCDRRNLPVQRSSFVDINIAAGYIDTVFAGGNGVTVGNSTDDRAIVLVNTEVYDGDHDLVGTLFGGNNQAEMSILPLIMHKKGRVHNVFGGGNAGNMLGSFRVQDVNDSIIRNISTYVLVNSDLASVSGSLYGGCNKATVAGATYVDVRRTHPTDGIENLYGGNDISGYVDITHVDVSGGLVKNIYGGSNGRYDYESGLVYPYKHQASDAAITTESSANPRPAVGTTYVNLYGGVIEADVFGGANLGDCENTNLVIDNDYSDAEQLVIHGRLFGAGNGDVTLLCSGEPYLGNVTGLAKTDLYSIHELLNATVYGGGNAGNVSKTLLTVHPAWNAELDAIYGGCYGSNVLDSAMVVLNGLPNANESVYNSRLVYGGNDYTGTVKNSVLTINNGRYYNVYGAGNGTSTDMTTCPLPNSENPTVNMYGGTVAYNLYGGGQMGMVYKGDTSMTYAQVMANQPLATDYAHVVVNMHGGTVGNDLFTGGAGNAEIGKQLIYGLKQLNMDGGTVKNSVYGGTESVSDGYPFECDSTGYYRKNNMVGDAALGRAAFTATTMRPSTILNFTGGLVGNHVYGGGYLGMVNGSIFINVGAEAVNNSPVWSNTYGGVANAYSAFRPEVVAVRDDAQPSQLIKADLMLERSIYNGANWGDAGAVYEFDMVGFIGGESRMLIDGDGYYTGFESGIDGTSLPSMDIGRSLLGSGTSTVGGDVYGEIEVRNYGKYADCSTGKYLFSIQRTNHLKLYNTAIEYEGEKDASSGYPSSNLSLNLIDTLDLQGFNFAFLDDRSKNIGVLRFLDEDGNLVNHPDTLARMNTMGVACDGGGTEPLLCDQLNTIVPQTGSSYSAIIIKNGSSLEINDENGNYGAVQGYGFLLADDMTEVNVFARAKRRMGQHGETVDLHPTDGGFFSTCNDRNDYTWTDVSYHEYPYTNYSDTYRTWSVGDGLRKRYLTIVAHANVALRDDNKLITAPIFDSIDNGAGGYSLVNKKKYNSTEDSVLHLAVAKSTLELPPSEEGRYYSINSIKIDLASGGEMKLLNTAFDIANWDTLSLNANDWPATVTQGEWHTLAGNHRECDGRKIVENPTYTFGLLVKPQQSATEGFSDNCPHTYSTCDSSTTISGNERYNQLNGYITHTVVGHEDIIPKLDFYLTYSPELTTTMIKDVEFSMMEYYDEEDPSNPGTYIRKSAGEITVVVTIATMIDSFRSQESELLAIYNEGIDSQFTRKVILPSTLQRRELYLASTRWEPLQTEDTAVFHIASFDDNNSLDLDSITFGVEVSPTENVVSSSTSVLGWYYINNKSVDVFKETSRWRTPAFGAARTSYAMYDDVNEISQQVSLKDAANNSGKGTYIGMLDGRAEAAMDLTLKFNGNQVFPKNGIIGRLVLTFDYYASGDYQGTFDLTLNVRTRPQGDTIYIASADSVVRGGISLYPDGTINACGDEIGERGKTPCRYLQSFAEALNSDVYTVGDVIAIIDTVKVEKTNNIVIRGADFSNIKVIRYSGDNYRFPGETSAYRGPMVWIDSVGRFTAMNMIFDGSLVSKKKAIHTAAEVTANNLTSTYVDEPDDVFTFRRDGVEYSSFVNEHSQPDTLVAHAPIFVVKDGGILTLSDQTVVCNNYNRPASSADCQGSAISLRSDDANKRPTVVFNYNVNIENNYVEQPGGNAQPAGAVYVHHGVVELGQENNTTVEVINNYYAQASPWVFWDTVANSRGVLRWHIDTVRKANRTLLQPANVHLTRTQRTSSTIPAGALPLYDDISDIITYSQKINAQTRIGISKWFPGEEVRDTIQVARVTRATPYFAQQAYENGVFVNDSAKYNIFYHGTINPHALYQQRCATFRPQLAQTDSYLYKDNPVYFIDGTHGAYRDSDGPLQRPLLNYSINNSLPCPTGGDTMQMSVYGGYYPYTFTWLRKISGEANFDTVHTETTSYTNDVITQILFEDAEHLDYSKVLQSNTGTLVTPNENMPIADDTLNVVYRVEVSDLMGCRTTKEAHLAVVRGIESSGLFNLNSRWNDSVGCADREPNLATNNAAEATRRYHGVRVTPYVMPSSDYGTVFAYDDNDNLYNLSTMTLCQGDKLTLQAMSTAHAEDRHTPSLLDPSQDSVYQEMVDNYRFIMWDFDPYDRNPSEFIVPSEDRAVTAYFGAPDYWCDVINDMTKANAVYDDNFAFTSRNGKSFVTTHNGDVHIYDERGLAWLISVVNGKNNMQARSFIFNNVYLHQKADGTAYDMHEHLWTPVGSNNLPFSGRFIGVASADTDTAALTDDNRVVIKNIIVNEPEMPYAGFFAFLDSARIVSISLENSLVHGSQYVGTMAGSAVGTKIMNCAVSDSTEGNTATILTTHYASGGMTGYAERSIIKGDAVKAKYMGDAVYSGGIIGVGKQNTVRDCYARNDNRMSALYYGGVAGNMTGSDPVVVRPSLFATKTTVDSSYILNNYVYITSPVRNRRTGGIVGIAENTVMENNYVYGDIDGRVTRGGIGAVLNDGSVSRHNYYQQGSASQAVGQERGQVQVVATEQFEGQGNQVMLSQPSYGVNNLTRVLNIWVNQNNANGEDYKQWRSDLDGFNNGYPVFGQPDIIPVSDTLSLSNCSSVEWEGQVFTTDTTVYISLVDSVQMIDSTVTLNIIVLQPSSINLTDTVSIGHDYNGYGFTVTAAETRLLRSTIDSLGSATLYRYDTLTSSNGCDSLITLVLTVTSSGRIEAGQTINVTVYPNPTTSVVNVEADGMHRAELFDNEGRRLAAYDATSVGRVSLNLSNRSTGIYYLRIHTPQGVVIRKIVKK